MPPHDGWDWKTTGQWVGILAAFIGMLMMNERRLTAVETAIGEQMKGYVIAFQNVNARLDRMEEKVDRLIERRR